MVAYHSDSNAILAVPFKTRADRHRLLAYAEMMQRLKEDLFEKYNCDFNDLQGTLQSIKQQH